MSTDDIQSVFPPDSSISIDVELEISTPSRFTNICPGRSGGGLAIAFYRNPLVMFGVGPAYLFVLRQRRPIEMMRNGWEPWLSTMGTNVAIAVAVATLIWFIGFKPFLLMQLPMTLLAGSIGVWLFYVQHQFEGTFWAGSQSEW
jgi:omega-6 fatty acid desaturase (delta-12 desaturase)